jgi:hypothetical protein
MNDTIAYLRSPEAIRERCEQLFGLAQSDQLKYFRCDLSRLDTVAEYVISVIHENYPTLEVPFHSRWRHFEVGGFSRLERLASELAHLSPVERAIAKFDLVIPSVLLDAGAGETWQYLEAGQVWKRSEGLAVASFDLFCQGGFSQHPNQTDAAGLEQMMPEKLAIAFQVTAQNPLVGLEGRSQLLQKLGQTLYLHPEFFGAENPRPGNLVPYLLRHAIDNKLSVKVVFQSVLEGLGDIWAGRLSLDGVNLGDVWHHSALKDQLVPFHKLSQWLTYSLLEPLEELGLDMTDSGVMTGLPEYRNGGLCLDLGLLQLKDPTLATEKHLPSSELIVEWRALTVSLLDRIADTIRQRLEMGPADLPLVKILQGGTWTAGRKIAAELRPGGGPPIQIESDGTVF